MTPQQIERMLRRAPGRVVPVVMRGITTHGHESGGPTAVLEGEGGSGGVQTTNWSVTIASGILPISECTGIDETLTVNGVAAEIRGIEQAAGEPDGDVIRVLLARI